MAQEYIMTLKIKIILSFLLLTLVPIQAQKAWSLDECIAYAIENNLELNNQKFNEASRRESYRQSIRELLPSINGSSGYNISYGRSEDPNTGSVVDTDFFSNNYSIGASIDLFRGFQKLNTIKASKFLFKAVEEETLQQKYLLGFRVLSAYYDIRFYEGMLNNAKEQLTISETNYAYVKKQIELGLKAGADLYESESLLLTDKLAVTTAENQLNAAKLVLIQEMNLEGETDIHLVDSLDDDSQKNETGQIYADSVYARSNEFLPSIRAQKLRVKASKKDLAVARGSLYPSLSFASGYRTGYFETNVDQNTGEVIDFKDQFRDNASRYIGFSLSVPISNRWSVRSRVKQQKIALDQAKNSLDIQEQELYKLIQQLVQEHNALTTEIAQSEKKVTAQKMAFAIAQKKYEREMISALEMFRAKALYTTAMNENLQVRIRSKVNEKTLTFYNGLSVFSINNNK